MNCIKTIYSEYLIIWSTLCKEKNMQFKGLDND